MLCNHPVTTFATFLMLSVSSQALAQQSARSRPPPEPAPLQTSNPNAVEEVLVTATRTQSLASKTPIALSVVTGGELRNAGVSSPINLTQQVPNLQINRAQGGLQISIRGVSSYDFAAKGDPSTAFLLDGVYIGRREAQDTSLFDVARIEVLRGPQGTLYGRNTTAGVINVITNRPSRTFGFSTDITSGNFGTLQVDSMVNLPVGDRLAFRLAGSLDQRDSYLIDRPGVANTLGKYRDNLSFRGQALWDITENISLLVQADHATQEGNPIELVGQSNFFSFNAPTLAAPPTLTLNLFNNPIIANANLVAIGAAAAQNGFALDGVSRRPFYANTSSKARRQLTYDLPSRTGINNKIWGIGGELKWDLGDFVLTYALSHRELEQKETGVFERGAIALPQTRDGVYKQDSHEVHLALDNEGPLKLQVGVYYFKEKNMTTSLADSTPAAEALFLPQFNTQFLGRFGLAPNTPIGSLPPPLQAAYNQTLAASRSAALSRPLSGFSVNPVTSESYAVFGQGTYSFSEGLRFTLGARYSEDTKSQDGYIASQQASPVVNLSTDALQLALAKTASDKVTWRVGIDYDVNDTSMIFATISTGYKAGGFNNGCSATSTRVSRTGLPCVRPGVSFGRPESELYYKPETLTSYEAGFKAGFLDNSLRVSGTAFIYDYQDLQLFRQDYLPNSPLLIFNAEEAKIKGIELEAVARVSAQLRASLSMTYTDATYGSLPLSVGSAAVQPNFEGKSLDRTPEYVVTAGLNYIIPVGESMIVADIRTRLSDSYVLSDFNNAIQFRQPSYTKTDISITFNAPNKRWYITGFVRNLEDYVELTYVLPGALSPPDPSNPTLPRLLTGPGTVIGGDPKTLGIRTGIKF
jgi:iron complex outermembrane recepter protein